MKEAIQVPNAEISVTLLHCYTATLLTTQLHCYTTNYPVTLQYYNSVRLKVIPLYCYTARVCHCPLTAMSASSIPFVSAENIVTKSVIRNSMSSRDICWACHGRRKTENGQEQLRPCRQPRKLTEKNSLWSLLLSSTHIITYFLNWSRVIACGWSNSRGLKKILESWITMY